MGHGAGVTLWRSVVKPLGGPCVFGFVSASFRGARTALTARLPARGMLFLKRMTARWLSIFGALALGGCVVGAERPASLAERRASPPPPDGHKSAGDLLVTGPPEPRREPRPEPPTADSVWVAGSWNWDGVRYVWQPGHWEPAHPSWLP